jgi:hypothetical protein
LDLNEGGDDNYGNAVRLWQEEEQRKESMIVKNGSMFRSYLYGHILNQ